MKLLVISHEYPPIGGGGANACYWLTKELATRGHAVDVVTAQYAGMPRLDVNGNVRIVRVKCKRKQRDKSSLYEMWTFLVSAWKKSVEEVKDSITKEKPYDKCLVFFGIPSGPIALYLKKMYGLPYVVRLGGGDIPGAQKRFGMAYRFLAPFIRSIWKDADSLVANSEGLKNRALAFEDRFPITIVENGVDVNFYDSYVGTMDAEASEEIRIIFVSRLIEGKGLQFVIPHMKEINSVSSKKVILTIVGDGPYRDELERMVVANEVREFVRFTGRLEKEDIRELNSKSDIFILPSMSEGMPNVVLEAMACGLPVVMTPCEGSKELIDGNGIIASIDNFTEAIVELCNDCDKRQKMGVESIERVRRLFTWQIAADKYEELL